MDQDKIPANQLRKLNWGIVGSFPPFFRLSLCVLCNEDPVLQLLQDHHPDWFNPRFEEAPLDYQTLREFGRLYDFVGQSNYHLGEIEDSGSGLSLFTQDMVMGVLFPDTGEEWNSEYQEDKLDEVIQALDGQTAKWGMVIPTSIGERLVATLQYEGGAEVEVGSQIDGKRVNYAYSYPAELIEAI